MATFIVRSASECGAVIRAARQEQGLSQDELARSAQVGRQWLVGFEAGDKPSAPLDMVLRLLHALNISIAFDGGPEQLRRPAGPALSASEVLQRFQGGAR